MLLKSALTTLFLGVVAAAPLLATTPPAGKLLYVTRSTTATVFDAAIGSYDLATGASEQLINFPTNVESAWGVQAATTDLGGGVFALNLNKIANQTLGTYFIFDTKSNSFTKQFNGSTCFNLFKDPVEPDSLICTHDVYQPAQNASFLQVMRVSIKTGTEKVIGTLGENLAVSTVTAVDQSKKILYTNVVSPPTAHFFKSYIAAMDLTTGQQLFQTLIPLSTGVQWLEYDETAKHVRALGRTNNGTTWEMFFGTFQASASAVTVVPASKSVSAELNSFQQFNPIGTFADGLFFQTMFKMNAQTKTATLYLVGLDSSGAVAFEKQIENPFIDICWVK